MTLLPSTVRHQKQTFEVKVNKLIVYIQINYYILGLMFSRGSQKVFKTYRNIQNLQQTRCNSRPMFCFNPPWFSSHSYNMAALPSYPSVTALRMCHDRPVMRTLTRRVLADLSSRTFFFSRGVVRRWWWWRQQQSLFLSGCNFDEFQIWKTSQKKQTRQNKEKLL